MVISRNYTSFKYSKFQKQLDEWLHNVNRYLDNDLEFINDYDDERICKYSLCGCCPYGLLENTRFSKGPCRYPLCPCPDTLQKKYREENKDNITIYEQNLFDMLHNIISDAEKRIYRSKDIQNSRVASIKTNKLLSSMEKDINKKIDESRILGLNGNVVQAKVKYIETQNAIQAKQEKEKEIIEQIMDKERNVHICLDCTAVIKLYAEDGKFEQHKLGKQHLAFIAMRESYEYLKNKGIHYSKSQNIGKPLKLHRL